MQAYVSDGHLHRQTYMVATSCVLDHCMKTAACGLTDSMMQGMGHRTLFCGDGINDFAALSAADVGFAVGATEAMVAAAAMTKQHSVAGMFFLPCMYVCMYVHVCCPGDQLRANRQTFVREIFVHEIM